MTPSILQPSRLRALLLLALAGSLVTLLAILSIPRDPENTVFLGFSATRLALVGLALLFVLLAAWPNWLIRQDAKRLETWVETLDNKFRHWLLYALVSLVTIAIFLVSAYALWLTFSTTDAQIRGYTTRLAPFTGLAFFLSALLLATILWPYFWQVHFHKALRQRIWDWGKNYLLFPILAPFNTHYRQRLKTVLSNNLVTLLFLPYGLTFAAVLIYTRSLRWFDQPEYPVITLHVVFALSPLLFIFMRGKARIADEIRTIFTTLTTRLRQHWKTYLVFGLLFIIVYFSLATLHIPGIDARVRKFEFQPSFYLVPYSEPFFYIRMGNLLDLILPLEFVSPLISLFFIIIWFAFLVYLNTDASPGNVVLTFVLTFSSAWAFIFMHYAHMELPSAIMGTLGLFAFLRKRYNLGILAFVVSLFFKASSFFFIAAAGVVFIYYLVRDWQEIKKVNFSLALIGALFFFINYLPLFTYIAGRGGPGYIVSINDTIVWLTPARESLVDFFTRYAPLSLAALAAFFVKDKHARAAIIVFLLAFAFRNVSRLAGSYYSIFYIPLLSLLAFSAIRAAQGFLKERSSIIAFSANASVVIVAILFLGATATQVNKVFLTQVNSNLNATIQSLAGELPPNALVFERKISLITYFLRYGRSDLRYDFYSEFPEEALAQLPPEGCVVWFSPVNDLGLTELDLAEIGFEKHPSFYDQNNDWRLLLRDCDN
ncbi:MAG: hypothetical protein DWQ07_15525 [Chloroflexi bacterium]|nr:MAG: hypothetical protein DWQ07_15525 [Chloroflexota bacterium]MBL1197255.1 hypothetical protein [Chloroflexota bacterium]NOH14548.1 hypothetical protein [Chloroflexota bacterium]